ncbi:hypothetical protein [Methylobacterium isbiliense]|uniref:hypothetical protein n=1 Tax=Methylobacterium isbiliense TaxID=315478 RepID=UPI001EE24467|nr:hypothetical protein [Methylobacterium isbiliense]MDN3625719.1 hypothetical protein [Methylobacterium isbiliense]
MIDTVRGRSDIDPESWKVLIMAHVTLTLDDGLLAWAQHEAALSGATVSDLVGKVLAEKQQREVQAQLAALDEYFNGIGWPGISASLPSREELYDRPHLRRLESSDLRDGSEQPGEESDKHSHHP